MQCLPDFAPVPPPPPPFVQWQQQPQDLLPQLRQLQPVYVPQHQQHQAQPQQHQPQHYFSYYYGEPVQGSQEPYNEVQPGILPTCPNSTLDLPQQQQQQQQQLPPPPPYPLVGVVEKGAEILLLTQEQEQQLQQQQPPSLSLSDLIQKKAHLCQEHQNSVSSATNDYSASISLLTSALDDKKASIDALIYNAINEREQVVSRSSLHIVMTHYIIGLSFQLRRCNRPDRVFPLNPNEAKNSSEMLHMLRDIRHIGLLGEAVEAFDDKPDYTRALAMTPYAKAIEANISAFFQYSATADVIKVIDVVKTWQELDLNLPLPHFVHALKRVTHKWTIQQARKNSTMTRAFIKDHLLNVILKWPDVVQEPTEENQITEAVNRAKRSLQRVVAKIQE